MHTPRTMGGKRPAAKRMEKAPIEQCWNALTGAEKSLSESI